jgi:hypothetical protein
MTGKRPKAQPASDDPEDLEDLDGELPSTEEIVASILAAHHVQPAVPANEAPGPQDGEAEDGADCPDYQAIKELAVALNRPAETLYILSESDPFFVRPTRQAAAEWFAEVWRVLDPPAGVHLRRLHYNLVSLPEDQRPPKRDGTVYQNTEADWRLLNAASVDARSLRLVDAARFTDRRAGEPLYFANEADEDREASSFHTGGEVEPPPPVSLAFHFIYTPRTYAMPAASPSVYVTPPVLAERYAVEVWAEKSTMKDVLMPLARSRNFTLVAGVGDLSLTHCHWLVERALAHGKPVRLLYISDFDPSGSRMPVGVARKIEHMVRRDKHDLDIRLEPLVLTREQVERYRLPRIPIKDTDKGKKQFEERFGEGAVELDALEALHPGELARIVTEAIGRYRRPTWQAQEENRRIEARVDADLARVKQEVMDEFSDDLADLDRAFAAMQAVIGPHQEALTAIADELSALADAANERARERVEAINAEAAAFYERAGAVWGAIAEALRERTSDAHEAAWASPDEVVEANSLYASGPGYVEQVDVFKAHLGMPTRRRGE